MPVKEQNEKPANLVGEFYRKNGNLSTKIEFYKGNRKLGPCWVAVPKWIVIAAILAGLIIIAVFITAIVVYLFPRPGLLDESCVGRSCLSSTGLKCVNNTCKCLTNQYYATKCIDKKANGEKCSSSTPCRDYTNLVCKSGTCQCEASTAYWNGSACISKFTYKKSCTSDTQCLTSLMLNCDTKTKTCICNSTRYLSLLALMLLRIVLLII